jgi:hypothetical protein
VFHRGLFLLENIHRGLILLENDVMVAFLVVPAGCLSFQGGCLTLLQCFGSGVNMAV